MKLLKLLISILFTLNFFLSLSSVQAQGTDQGRFKFEQPKGFGIQALNPGGANQAEGIVETIVTNVITLMFTVGGLGVIIYFVWGAVDWILAGGDKEKISGARKKMTNAIIGLTLLSLSYVIINIVGEVVGFNPLGYLQIRGLGDPSTPTLNQAP